MRNTRSLLTFMVVTCTLLSLAPGARADEPVVAQRLYDMGGRLELALTEGMSIFDKYTLHVGSSLGLAYYFNDYVGLEVEGGYNYVNGDKDLLNEILEVGQDNIAGIERLPLTDLKSMTWFGTGGLVFNFLYGKLNLSAEVDFNLHVYAVAGGGVAGFKYSKLDPNAVGIVKVTEDVGMKPIFYYGGGLRIHFPYRLSLRVEVRNHAMYDKYTAQTKAEGGTVPQDKEITDFVNITAFRLGVCYSFF